MAFGTSIRKKFGGIYNLLDFEGSYSVSSLSGHLKSKFILWLDIIMHLF